MSVTNEVIEKKIKSGKIVTVCYDTVEYWNTREEAENYFLQGMMCSEGSERDRYTNVYCKLVEGKTYCTDDFD